MVASKGIVGYPATLLSSDTGLGVTENLGIFHSCVRLASESIKYSLWKEHNSKCLTKRSKNTWENAKWGLGLCRVWHHWVAFDLCTEQVGSCMMSAERQLMFSAPIKNDASKIRYKEGAFISTAIAFPAFICLTLVTHILILFFHCSLSSLAVIDLVNGCCPFSPPLFCFIGIILNRSQCRTLFPLSCIKEQSLGSDI